MKTDGNTELAKYCTENKMEYKRQNVKFSSIYKEEWKKERNIFQRKRHQEYEVFPEII